MARRILAAFVVIGAVLTLAPEVLPGEPTTTGRTARATTTTMLPNPQRVYPRRPGAKYDDIEAEPHASVMLAASLSIARSTIEPRRAMPRRWRPARASDARKRGLADGYTPISTDTQADVLHVVVREKDGIGSIPLLCSATSALDGNVLIPYDDGGQPPLPVPKPTATGAPKPGPSDLDLYLPLGARRGRIYLACQQVLLVGLTTSAFARAVWAIDV